MEKQLSIEEFEKPGNLIWRQLCGGGLEFKLLHCTKRKQLKISKMLVFFSFFLSFLFSLCEFWLLTEKMQSGPKVCNFLILLMQFARNLSVCVCKAGGKKSFSFFFFFLLILDASNRKLREWTRGMMEKNAHSSTFDK